MSPARSWVGLQADALSTSQDRGEGLRARLPDSLLSAAADCSSERFERHAAACGSGDAVRGRGSGHAHVPRLQQARGVVVGRDYPPPIVDHASAREEALALFGRTLRR